VVFVVVFLENIDCGDHLVVYRSNPSSFGRLLRNLLHQNIVNDKICIA
jgi:hypothetical protein